MTTARALASILIAVASSAHAADAPRNLAATAGGLSAGAKAPAGPPSSLLVFPNAVSLDGPRDEQRLVVVGVWPDGRKWDLTRAARYASDNAATAAVDARGLVAAAGDGTTTVAVEAAGLRAAVPVAVARATADVPVSFNREIEPVLTKAGCNAGSCHGAQHGRGGFRLSLFGFDPAFDHAQIVQSNEGRRLVLSDPDRSILLAKPALVMEHGGGERLPLNGRDYRRFKQWLEDGVPEPAADDPVVTKLEVYPPSRVMVPGEPQQLAVTATWSDGRREDVTATAQFDALNDAVAAVTPQGLVTAKDVGETHVMVRFGGQAAVAQVTLPFAHLAHFPKLPANNFIDERLIAKWKDLGLTPSPPAPTTSSSAASSSTPSARCPTPEEVRTFLADADPDKRAKAIDAVLDRPEFIDWWALKWGDLLRINRTVLQEKGMWSFHNWVRGQIRDNRPVDEFVRDIVTAEGSTFTEGPANFFQVGKAADEWTETTAQVFLGIRIGCAKCHHHPFEKWSAGRLLRHDGVLRPARDEAEPGVRPVRPGDGGLHQGGRRGLAPAAGRHGQAAPARRAGDGGRVRPPHEAGGVADRAGQPAVRRNVVNRFWGYIMGRGLVEPLDDMRATNPASNPELLDALAAGLRRRTSSTSSTCCGRSCNSRAYQLDSSADRRQPGGQANMHFTRYTVKRLTAEQLADALDSATGTREKYLGLPLGTRAIQLPDTEVKSYLMDTFGRPARQVLCECERTTKPNIAQALHLLNGDFLNRKIAAKTGRVERLVSEKTPLPQAAEELFLAAWGRPPTADESAKALGWVKSAPTPREGLQDLLWVLLNGRDFLFNR